MQPDEVADFIAQQLGVYIDEFYGGDPKAFAKDHDQSEESVKNYLYKRRKPGWAQLRKWFDKGMSPLWMFLDIGPKRWNRGDEDVVTALRSKLQAARETSRMVDRLLAEAEEFV